MSAGLTPSDAGDARARVAEAMPLQARVVDVARFVVRPSYVAQPMAWGRAAALALLLVFALDLALDTLVAELTLAWDAEASFLPQPIDYPATLAEDLFGFLILAPITEELAFRGWLSGRIAALRFGAWGLAAMGLFTASLYLDPDYTDALSLAGVVLVFVGLVQWSRNRDFETDVPAWFTRHFHWIVWGSSLAFGLIHLGNYEPLAHPLGLLVVLPQTIGGLLLAYTRTRLGLGAAIAHHAAYNAVFLASDYGWW
ncbi:MAG TPA: CPBP family glutamic-type intramembrane protease [Erythrobacter sp.]|nr:CPBP family glutamic-type intramembrane protease [Erythrobacter sp.]